MFCCCSADTVVEPLNPVPPVKRQEKSATIVSRASPVHTASSFGSSSRISEISNIPSNIHYFRFSEKLPFIEKAKAKQKNHAFYERVSSLFEGDREKTERIIFFTFVYLGHAQFDVYKAYLIHDVPVHNVKLLFHSLPGVQSYADFHTSVYYMTTISDLMQSSDGRNFDFTMTLLNAVEKMLADPLRKWKLAAFIFKCETMCLGQTTFGAFLFPILLVVSRNKELLLELSRASTNLQSCRSIPVVIEFAKLYARLDIPSKPSNFFDMRFEDIKPVCEAVFEESDDGIKRSIDWDSIDNIFIFATIERTERKTIRGLFAK